MITYPHCWVCKKKGDCSKGTMHCVEVEEGVSIYLCPEHYKNQKEVVACFLETDRQQKRKKVLGVTTK